jgi:hypothetical protein
MMYRSVGVALAALVSALALVSPVAATNSDACSPSRDICVTSSSGTATNKDKDGDFSTVTQSEELSLFYSVFNNAETAQTVHVTVVLDGPGTARDATLVDEDVRLEAPTSPRTGTEGVQDRFAEQVKHRDWPAGAYSLTVTASGSESVSTTSTFTISY